MNYWLDLFTGRTWKEFQDAGARVTGFRSGRNRARARNIKPGDIFLCYLVGVKRWVGILEAESDRFDDESPIFSEEPFPVRFRVKPIVLLTPEQGIPMEELRGRLTFFPQGSTSSAWSGYVRSSPTIYKPEDGAAIVAVLKSAAAQPVERPVDRKKLERSANLYKTKVTSDGEEIERVIGVPIAEDESDSQEPIIGHTEMQWRLLDLGAQIGLNIWAPKNDRGPSWNGKRIAELPRLLDKLPTQFDKVTNEIVGAIDVLWCDGQAIVAAFEVEHSTSVYSGLLRMSDLLTMQPNLDIKLYLVGPDDRQSKFEKEVARATFASRRKPLHSICSFLPYSVLCARLDEAKNVVRYLKPEFLDEIAISYDPAEDVAE